MMTLSDLYFNLLDIVILIFLSYAVDQIKLYVVLLNTLNEAQNKDRLIFFREFSWKKN